MTAETPSIDGFSDFRRIGHGGFSVVYEAVQIDLGRTVAVKVLNLDVSDPAARRRFERECRAIGALSGVPGVVAIHQSAVTDDGRLAIVMELMAESLERRVIEQGPLSIPEVCEVGAVLAGALAEVHAIASAHRDVKPGNVLISRRGDVAISDFGIALVAELETSSQTEGSLSPPFAPPERFGGTVVDEQRADIYALGATLHFALTGRAPFGTSSSDGGILGLIERITNDPLPALDRRDAPGDVVALLVSMMAKDPGDRPASVSEVELRFRSFVESPRPGPALAPAQARDSRDAWWASDHSAPVSIDSIPGSTTGESAAPVSGTEPPDAAPPPGPSEFTARRQKAERLLSGGRRPVPGHEGTWWQNRPGGADRSAGDDVEP